MARGEITEVVSLSTTGAGIDQATVEIRKRSTGLLATVYVAETGSTTVTNPLLSNQGRLTGWLDEGSYQMLVTKTGVIQPQTIDFEVINGDTVVSNEAAISTHIPATTNVHGIADTSRLITIDNIGTYAPSPDLTPYARLSGANFTGALTVSGSAVVTASSIGGYLPSLTPYALLSGADFTGPLTVNGSTVVTAANIGTYAPAPDLTPYAKLDGSRAFTGLVDFAASGIRLGSDVVLSRSAAGMGLLQAGGTNPTKLIVKATGSQTTTNLQEWQGSTGTPLSAVKSDGTVAVLAAGKGIQLTSPDGTITKTLTLGNDGALQIA